MKENLKVSTAFLLIFLISSCSSFSFYKVPVTQGNIFDDEESIENGVVCKSFTTDDIKRSEIVRFIVSKLEKN